MPGPTLGIIFFSKMLRVTWGPFFYLMCTRVSLFRAAKLSVREVDHWHPSGLSKDFMACTESNFPYVYLKSIKFGGQEVEGTSCS